MFKRIILEEWHTILPIAGFVLTASTFLVLAIRALMMRRTEIESMSQLPLNIEDRTQEVSQ